MPTEWENFSRAVNVLVKLGLDECANVFGVYPCTATGSPGCYYSCAWCPIQGHYVKSIRWLLFTLHDRPPVPGCLNFIKTMPTQLGARIQPDQFLTAPANIEIALLDPPAVSWANPGKPFNAEVNNLEIGGTFWGNLLARVPHYQGRPLEVWIGLENHPLSDYRCYFRGVVDTIKESPGERIIAVRDKLSLLDLDVPPAQDSENVLTADLSASKATIPVSDGDQFAPASATLPRQAVIEDDSGNEIIEYRDQGGAQLKDCLRGMYGTKANNHPAGCKVRNIIVVADQNLSPNFDWSEVEGLPLDRCFLDLLCIHGGISVFDTAFVDVGVSLAGAALASGNLALLGAENLPGNGALRIQDEVISYGQSGGSTPTYSDVDARDVASPVAHNMGQGTGLEAWHFVKFETGAGEIALDRLIFRMKRNGTITGKIYARLYSDNAGNPGTMLADFYSLYASIAIPRAAYGDVAFSRHCALNELSSYWAAVRLELGSRDPFGIVPGGGGGGSNVHVDYELETSADASKFKHGAANYLGEPVLPPTGIAGLPGFRVQLRGGTYPGLSVYTRGAYGTTPAAHALGTTVYLSRFSREAGIWRPGALFKKKFEQNGNLKDLVQGLRRSSFTHLWQSSDGLIQFAANLLPTSLEELRCLTDGLNLISGSVSRDRNDDARKTRVTMYYCPLEADPGADTIKWKSVVLHVDTELEDENYLAKILNKPIYADWCYRRVEALYTAAQYLALFKNGAGLLKFNLDAKDAEFISEGAAVLITTDQATGITGSPRSLVRYFVLEKHPINEITWQYLAIDVSGGRDDLRYGVIAPAELTDDWGDWTDEARARYCAIGSAGSYPDGNRVGPDPGVPGYSIE